MPPLPYTSDTSPEAAKIQLALIRQMSPLDCSTKAIRLSNAIMAQSKAAIRESFPDLDELELKVKFIEIHYGKALAEGCRSKLLGKHID